MLAVLLGIAAAALAQPFTPRIGYVYPAGGRQGTTFQIAVGGQYLDSVTNVFVSGRGVRGVVVDFNKPMSQGQFNMLRDKLKELQDKRAAAFKNTRKRGARPSTNLWTAADEKMVADIREKILKNPPNRNAVPAIAETATIKVTLAPDAEPGDRDLRLGTPSGLSNPLRFCVGQWPEFSKPVAKAANPDADRFRERFGRQVRSAPTNSEMRVSLPATVNGQIMPGSVDRFRFAARKGQRLVVAASARTLIPYLPDAVPGWFQATLALFDAKGRELAYDDDYRFNPDPVLFYEIPADGDYVIEIKDSIYRGRQDFVYRVTVGELPFVTSIFPLGGKAGAETPVELKGWNLPVTTLTPESKTTEPGLQLLSVRKDERVSNLVPFAVDTLPECLEKEPNNAQGSAQKLSLPVLINGRIELSGDWDVFRFEGRAGDAIVAEVHARRLGSPLDSVLKLTDATGQQLALNDDHEDKGSGLNTHHADSLLNATLPADGTYYLHVGDTQRKGGAEYAYRLRLSAPRPDFELRVVPSSLSVRGGTSVPLTVYALRKDGFSNEIALVLKDAPDGFTLSGARVPANQDQVRLTLTAPATTQAEPASLVLEGRASSQGGAIVHPAVPAEDMMQAFAYRHLVPAKELEVAVIGRWTGRSAVRILGATPLKIPAGGTARIGVGMPANNFLGKLHLELSEPPEGITIKDVAPMGRGTEIVLQSDATKAKPGLTGNLIVYAFAGNAPDAGKAKAQPNRRRAPLGALPAIPFEIVRQP
ncbi:MAG: PPC domain-containing protein [Verrucomicrobia bacterium]|nr:PPC domain-containing protein [Verrucomicrobiota bacterium]